ncbi:MAG: MBL fold metallo-hydrolase [candidate division FCPU426 bacterium]
MQVTFLGTGTSHGIPVIGCRCAVCASKDPRDQRGRTALLVRSRRATLLVDAPPELRLQLVRSRVDRVDALLLTHAHADHISGLDDVRIFSEREQRAFPVYGPASALRQVRERFGYVFRPTQEGGGKPRLSLRAVSAPFAVQGVRVRPLAVWHGKVRVFGYRIGNLAYLTDVSRIPESVYPALRGLSVLVLDALRREPHNTHFHLDRAVAEARRIGARKTYFTHLCHRLGHADTERTLPPGMRLAYDGLTLRLSD